MMVWFWLKFWFWWFVILGALVAATIFVSPHFWMAVVTLVLLTLFAPIISAIAGKVEERERLREKKRHKSASTDSLYDYNDGGGGP
jgi:hypothetical protein